jgi:uroporphyrinogen-III synthase
LKIKNILVSQPKPESEKSPYFEIAKKYNVNIDFKKFFKNQEVTTKEFRKERVNFDFHTAIIFASKNAIDHFFKLCMATKTEIPETLKYYCLSEPTALYLQNYIQYRKRKIFFSTQGFPDLVSKILKDKDEHFLLPCSDDYNHELINMLDANSINYSKAVVYRHISEDFKNINIYNYDMLVFFSPHGIKSLYHNFPAFEQKNIKIAALGPSTWQAAKEAGLQLEIEAPNEKAPSMVMALEQYLQKTNKK